MSGNDNEPLAVECEVVEIRDAPGEWLVEAINVGSEGEIYRTIFAGQDAKERALEFAAWKFGHNGIVMQPPARQPRPRPVLTVVPDADTSEASQVPGRNLK